VGLLGGGKKVPCIKLVIAQKLEEHHAEIIGSCLGLNVDHTAAGSSKFRAVIAGRNLEFLDRIDRRNDVQLGIAGVVVIHPIEQEIVVALAAAVGFKGQVLSR